MSSVSPLSSSFDQNEEDTAPTEVPSTDAALLRRFITAWENGDLDSFTALLADDALAARLTGGPYMVIYLSPRDYHRVHFPAGGKIIVAGNNGQFVLARYSSDGSLDPTFGIGGKLTTSFGSTGVSSIANSVAVQADGKIVVALGLVHLRAGAIAAWRVRLDPDPQAAVRLHGIARSAPREARVAASMVYSPLPSLSQRVASFSASPARRLTTLTRSATMNEE